jgi:hypothetical protein
LANAHPLNFIHQLGQTRVGFISKRGGDNSLYSRSARRVSQEARINSISCDDSERVWRLHEATLAIERPVCQATAIEMPKPECQANSRISENLRGQKRLIAVGVGVCFLGFLPSG